MPEQSQPSKAPQSSPEQPAEAAPTGAQASEDLTAAADYVLARLY